MSGWRSITDLTHDEQVRVLQLARFGAIKVRARRVYAVDYEEADLARAEAEAARRHQEELDRARRDPTYVIPIVPAAPGTKPWLDGVPLRRGMKENAEVPLDLLTMMDPGAWRSGRFEFTDRADNRRSWLLEGVEIREQPAETELAEEPRDPRWTVHQAVAWLASRDEALVAWVADRIRHHNDEGNEGYLFAWVELAQRVRDRWASQNDEPFSRVDHERERLRAACEQGRVRATGIPADRGARRLVPPGEFVAAEMSHHRRLGLHRTIGDEAEAARWLELRFSAEDIRKLEGSAVETSGVAKAVSPPKRSAGRPRGSGGYWNHDLPLFEEMKRLIDGGMTVNAAATDLAWKAHGSAEPSSKVARLRRGYTRWSKIG